MKKDYVIVFERQIESDKTQRYALNYENGKITVEYVLYSKDGKYSIEDSLEFTNEKDAMKCANNWADVG